MSAGSSPKKRAGAGVGAGAPGAKSGGKSLNTSDRKALHARMKQRQLDLVGGGQVTLKQSRIYLDIYVYTYIHMYIYICMYVCMYVYIYI